MAKQSKTDDFRKEVLELAKVFKPESLTGPGKSPIVGDHAANVVQLVEWGQTRLAADHLLFPDLEGVLAEHTAGALRQLNYRFALGRILRNDGAREKAEKIRFRFYAYEFALELSLNYLGLESRWLDEFEKEVCIDLLLEMLAGWESLEVEETGAPAIAEAAAGKILDGMELVQGGVSMVAQTAMRIRKNLRGGAPVTHQFLDAAENEILENIYYRMVVEDKCKFGNDYALGLRWLRHLGFEQVSTNPVLAAKAYDDDSGLTRLFVDEAACNPCCDLWRSDPQKYADEITLYATLFALWDNLHVYRPVFYNLRPETGGGVVSFQLNPNIAHLADESVADALNALRQVEADLQVYDSYLLAGHDSFIERGRANLVIKVSCSHPAARKIASAINSYGLGSNITVVYTVGQEVTLILDEMAGMAAAMRKGILPTQLYMTNMGGRLESHLRETKLEDLFAKLKKKIGEKKARAKLDKMAKANGTAEKVKAAESYEQAVLAVTRFAAQKTIDAAAIAALADVASRDELLRWESDLGKSGTLVARRVWSIFFSEKNREKWITYLSENYLLSPDQARFIMSRINYLPASKRKPEDTYWTLTSQNMVHTEFGNHQENVRKMSVAEGFDLSSFTESIRDAFDTGVTERLNKIPDFPKAYELNAELNKIIKYVGVEGDFGTRGVKPNDWQNFGAVQKTSVEFKAAYDGFRDRILKVFPQ
ncbi:MAG: hypothetical protein WCX65_09520 [bacterium]